MWDNLWKFMAVFYILDSFVKIKCVDYIPSFHMELFKQNFKKPPLTETSGP